MRLAINRQFPDYRNARAARLLSKLASQAASLSDESWRLLAPYFLSERWDESLRKASRQVGFYYRKVGFAFYLRSFIRLLEEPASDG